MYKYTCNTCYDTSIRSVPGWDIECHCGGMATTKQNNSKYSYACPKCGNTWISDRFNANICPDCGYWLTVCSYDENGQKINQEEYEQIKRNKDNGLKYLLHVYGKIKVQRLAS
ncbi:hypothetical protein [Sporolituus thermophilus]|uniref:Replication restart DNA helicase PriA n=1 Tax=Sporolituus thermophilus DSM 23256 TaxID=1123285 RepID=A0A1G7JZW2_9FIRM|nr:hypothetical protein [Sporolituus thermophilus]SDF30437.1 hypothetical protein SAMN05660235_01146 [Sporolituus thermophilus DSM 23256]